MVIGIGVDLIQVERLERLSPQFWERVFTAAERAYCESFAGTARLERYAGRFAIKESVSKALGTGFSDGIRWHDIEGLVRPTGGVLVSLHGKALARFTQLGGATIHATLSHSRGSVIAMAVIESSAMRELEK